MKVDCSGDLCAARSGSEPRSTDDMPDLGGDTPPESCKREGRRAGYTGIERGNKFPRDSAPRRCRLEEGPQSGVWLV